MREREQEEIDRLTELLNDEIAAAALSDVGADPIGEQRLEEQQAALASYQVRWHRTLSYSFRRADCWRSSDVALKDGDRLLIPKFSQEVTIIGEVQRPTSYLFDRNFSKNYIEQSGGFKRELIRETFM